MAITSVTYFDLFRLVPSFISLDISKKSTGWVKFLNGVVTTGTFGIEASDDNGVEQRKEFRQNLIDILKDDEFEYLFIEDIIGSSNFKTARILYQLNPLADDMAADGLIKVKNIIREGNKTWKKNLKLASGYKSSITSSSDDKKSTREAMHLLRFGDGTNMHIIEDVYDAAGLAVGVIFRMFVAKNGGGKQLLKTDITKGYNIRQFESMNKALEYASKVSDKFGRDVIELDLLGKSRDLKYHFKKQIESLDNDSPIFVIKVETNKIGILAIKKKFDLDLQNSYLVASR